MTTLERSQTTVYLSTPDTATLDVLLVRFAREWYAIPVLAIREIVRHRAYTPVPGAPATIPGIINQRGLIVPVVNLRLLLGFGATDATSATRLVLVQHDDIDMALLIEAVLDLDELPIHAIEPAPSALDPRRAGLLRGVVPHGDQVIGVLNLGAVVARLREEAA